MTNVQRLLDALESAANDPVRLAKLASALWYYEDTLYLDVMALIAQMQQQ